LSLDGVKSSFFVSFFSPSKDLPFFASSAAFSFSTYLAVSMPDNTESNMLKAFDRSCFSSCATTSSSAGVEETETEDNFNDEDVSTDTLVLRFVAVVVAVVVVTEPDKSLCVCFETFAVVAVVVLDALT
jgi:hypothetical protein